MEQWQQRLTGGDAGSRGRVLQMRNGSYARSGWSHRVVSTSGILALTWHCLSGPPVFAYPASPPSTVTVGALPGGAALLPANPSLDTALFASPTRLDRIGRVVAPVMINGSGPFRFIIDTAASRSTMSPRLAAALGLDPAHERTVIVNGITGTGEVPSVPVALLQAGDFVLRDDRFPVVCTPPTDCADGILGVAGLKLERLVIDFQHDRVELLRSRRQGAPLGFYSVAATRLEGGLLCVPAVIGGVHVRAIIDTGSERTLGNPALHAALLARYHRDPASHVTTVYGATAETSDGLQQDAPPIEFKTATISNTSIIFGDFHIFDVWNMRAQPALIVGMDVLGTLRTLILDFKESQMYMDSRELAGGERQTPVARPERPLRLDAFGTLSRR